MSVLRGLLVLIMLLAFLPGALAQENPAAPTSGTGVPVGGTPIGGPETLPKAGSNPSETPNPATGTNVPSIQGNASPDAKAESQPGAPTGQLDADKTAPTGASDSDARSAPIGGWADKSFPKPQLQELDRSEEFAGSQPPTADNTSEVIRNVFLGLALLSGIFIAVVWYLKKSPRTKKFFGAGPVKVLSRSYLGPRQALFLIKAGERVLLIGQGSDGLRTLMEISEPGEVSRTLAMVEENNPGSMTKTFKDAMAAASGSGAASRRSEGAVSRRSEEASRRPNIDTLASDDDQSIRVDPGYSTQLKLAALRNQLDQSKANTP